MQQGLEANVKVSPTAKLLKVMHNISHFVQYCANMLIVPENWMLAVFFRIIPNHHNSAPKGSSPKLDIEPYEETALSLGCLFH